MKTYLGSGGIAPRIHGNRADVGATLTLLIM